MDLSHAALATVIMLAAMMAVILLYIKSHKNAKLLRKQLESAVEANNARTGFFSSMVHELKTPLSIILGAVQLIEMKRKDRCRGADEINVNGIDVSQNDCVENHLTAIKCNCYRMMRLTNNLLDLARSDAGYLALRLVNCDLCVLLDEIVRSVLPYALKKQLDLRFNRPQGGIVVALDIEKTERIMLNLLSNAIKFTNPGGSIIVSAYTADGRVFISVKDTGVGIPADRQGDIFDLYRQSGLNARAEKEGYGIGLFLVKTFVELHHGNIRLVSERSRGSEFIVDLPAVTVKFSPDVSNSGDLKIMADDAANIEFSGGYPVNS
jgi:two-component system cell cycle sensor histidine kinase PleC